MKRLPIRSTAPLVVLLAALLAPAAQAQTWVLQPGSTLGFSSTFEGAPFSGRFKQFSATIAFDPAKPQACTLHAAIVLASADTDNPDRDKMLPTADFFDVAHFPQAHYQGGDCRPDGPGRYRAQGTLTLRGVSKPVPLLLHFSASGTDALLTLDASLPRLAFAVGGGQWASASAIGLDVAVHGVLKLAPAP
jgi:polyisoprenoid-binding protein YceI